VTPESGTFFTHEQGRSLTASWFDHSILFCIFCVPLFESISKKEIIILVKLFWEPRMTN
jgi:hypothetical protein